MTRITTILLILFTLGSTAQSLQAQPDSSKPYLYYYSQLLGGLIIEHPDGSDSRQIAADVIPPNMTGLSGPGWSPSGKYFAAYRMDYVENGSGAGTPYLIDLNGKSVAGWLTTVVRTLSMQWSPTGEDTLLVIGTFSSERYIDFGTFGWLIDAQHDKVLAEYGINVGMLAYGMSEITWDTAHQQIVFYLRPDTYNVGDYYRVTMHFDGTIVRELTTADNFMPLSASLHAKEDEDVGLYTGDNISPSGTYKTHGDHLPTITDTRTAKTIELPRNTQATTCRDYLWSKNEQFMITVDGALVAGGGCGAAVIGITNPQASLWRELGNCSWYYPPCVGWLPQSVDIQSLPLGAPKPLQLDPIKIEYASGDIIFTTASALIPPMHLNCVNDSAANILDPKTNVLLYHLKYSRCPSLTSRFVFPNQTPQIAVAEDTDHHLLATFSDWDSYVSIWKFQNEQYEHVLKLNSQGFTLEFTNHNTYLRARNFAGWKIYSVADILAATKPQ